MELKDNQKDLVKKKIVPFENVLLCIEEMPSQTKIHRLIHIFSIKLEDFERFLVTNKILDARRQGVPTEAYEQYAARRSDRRQHSR